MEESFADMKRVPAEWLQQRLETVKPLESGELELYEVAKDKLTGEHYLHYAYLHKQIAAIGPEATEEETFHQLMRLDSDEVLGFIFGEQSYRYPEAWTKAFLRNGPEGDYVWFDPSYIDDEAQSELIGQSLKERLMRFKRTEDLSQEAVRKLLEELDRARGSDPS